MNGAPIRVNATVSSIPAAPAGKSPGAAIAVCMQLSGNRLV